MRFLYKIHSGYDGFRPAVLPDRMREGRMRLRWRRYIDVVEKGWECWVYFHGPHRFRNGVYAKGIVDGIDLEASEVSLRVREHKTDAPITSPEASDRIAKAVATRYRQVFLWPDDWIERPVCEPAACGARQCEDCETWRGLPLIRDGEWKPPERMRRSAHAEVVPGHWFAPRRCYEKHIAGSVRDLTSRLAAFKLGEMAYAYPFARSMFEQLRRRDLLDFNYVVPVPLSPEKAKRGETHRTMALAKELGRLLAVRVRDMLSLSAPVSKRRMQAQSRTPPQFERAYRQALRAEVPANARRILLVDDVMTRGSTAAEALYALDRQRSGMEIVVAVAGQMIVKEAVADDRSFKVA